MKRRVVRTTLFAALCVSSGVRAAPGTLGPDRVIESDALGYRLQYRVYTPQISGETTELPVIYVTDGQWYIDPGGLPDVLDRMIESGEIEPTMAVFVDSRDPDDLSDNRRNSEFFCNEAYARFYAEELIPAIDERHPTRADRRSRVVLGLSFGGLASACFGLQATDSFGGIAMQSPAMHPVRGLHDAWERAPRLPLRIFLSTGTRHDNEASTRRLHEILQAKEYDMRYLEVPHGHDWNNWRPLLDDVLEFFFGGAPRSTDR